jgi:hypothetical protein
MRTYSRELLSERAMAGREAKKKTVWGIFVKGSTYYDPPELVIEDVPASTETL